MRLRLNAWQNVNILTPNVSCGYIVQSLLLFLKILIFLWKTDWDTHLVCHLQEALLCRVLNENVKMKKIDTTGVTECGEGRTPVSVSQQCIGEARKKPPVPPRGLSEDLKGRVCRVVYSKDSVTSCLCQWSCGAYITTCQLHGL